MDVTELIYKLKKGEESAFKELVLAYSGRLLTIAKIYSRNSEDARDMLQDAFIVIFNKISKFDAKVEKALYAWMKKIVINLCLSRNQKKYLKMEQSIENMTLHHAVDAMAITELSHEEIIKLINELPDGYRQVFALFAIEGYSHKEIAHKLSIGESSSRSQYLRARRLLQIKVTNLFKVTSA